MLTPYLKGSAEVGDHEFLRRSICKAGAAFGYLSTEGKSKIHSEFIFAWFGQRNKGVTCVSKFVAEMMGHVEQGQRQLMCWEGWELKTPCSWKPDTAGWEHERATRLGNFSTIFFYQITFLIASDPLILLSSFKTAIISLCYIYPHSLQFLYWFPLRSGSVPHQNQNRFFTRQVCWLDWTHNFTVAALLSISLHLLLSLACTYLKEALSSCIPSRI